MNLEEEEVRHLRTSSLKHVRALLVRSEDLRWTGLRTTLQELHGVRVVGETRRPEEAVELARELQPDATFVADELSGTSALVIAQQLRQRYPESKIVVVSQRVEHAALLALARLGIHGYLLWDDVTARSLETGLAALVEGDWHVVSAGPVDELAAAPEDPRHRQGKAVRLSDLELKVLNGLAAGQSQLAEMNNLGLRTVDDVVHRLKGKLEAPTLFVLGMKAHALGFGLRAATSRLGSAKL